MLVYCDTLPEFSLSGFLRDLCLPAENRHRVANTYPDTANFQLFQYRLHAKIKRPLLSASRRSHIEVFADILFVKVTALTSPNAINRTRSDAYLFSRLTL